MASSEFAPLAKTGGLADVVAALSQHLAGVGHDVRVLIPRYSRIDGMGLDIEAVPGLGSMSTRLGDWECRYGIDQVTLPESGFKLYLLRCPDFFQRESIYTDDDDEYLRFVLLSRAVIEMCQRLGFSPDIMHCHDWQTGFVPLYLKTTYAWDRLFRNTRSALTIHNIGYQGMFPAWVLPQLSLEGVEHHLHQDDLKDGVINFLKTGVLYADVVTTVSPTYAREILGEDYGMGLNDLLRSRLDSVTGILNGVDYAEWDPALDTLIPANFSPADLAGKRDCKEALMRETGLEVKPDRPLIGIVSRLVGQKGFELVEEVVPNLLGQRDFAITVLGSGERRYEDFFNWLQAEFQGRASFYQGYSNRLAHWIEAGADMFLMPSLYEPCGLNQMYSLKYGTVPVVRETGGLADSVRQIDARSGTGNGILFRDYNGQALSWAMNRALDLYSDEPLWAKVRLNGMQEDFSWRRQGRDYVELYREVTGRS